MQVRQKQALFAQQRAQADALWQMEEAVKDLAAKASKKDVPSLIDNKGLGKPNVFDNSEDHFLAWAATTANTIVGVHLQLRLALEWTSDQEQEINPADWQEELGSGTGTPIEHIEAFAAQSHSALAQLTKNESFDMARNSNQDGLEAWRRLSRRWDLATGERQ